MVAEFIATTFSIGPAPYGNLEIDILAFASTAGNQDNSKKPDSYDLIVLHKSLPRDVMV